MQALWRAETVTAATVQTRRTTNSTQNPLPRGCKWRVFADWLLALSG